MSEARGSSLGFQVTSTGAGMVFAQAAAFLAVLIIARQLGAAALGVYQVLVGFVVSLALVAKSGFDESLAYTLPRIEDPEVGNGLIVVVAGSLAIVAMLVGAIVALAAGPISQIVFSLPPLEPMLKTVVLLLPSYVLMLLATAALRGLGRLNARAVLLYGVGSMLFLGGLVALWLTAMDLRSVVRLRGVVWLAIGLMAMLVALRGTRFRARWPAAEELRRAATLSFVMVFVGLFQYLAEQPLVDLALVGRFGTADEVGVYAAAARLGALALLPLNAVAIVVAPAMVRSDADFGDGQWQDIARRGRRWLSRYVPPVSCFLVLFPAPLLALFGDGFAGGVGAVRVYAIGYGIAGILGLNVVLLLAKNRGLNELTFGLLTVVTMIAVGYALGGLIGPLGVAIGTSFALVLFALTRQILTSRLWPAQDPALGELGRSLASCLPAGVLAWGLLATAGTGLSLLGQLLVGGMSFAATHTAAMWVWSRARP